MTEKTKPVAVLIGAGMVAKTHVAACLAASSEMQLKGVLSRRLESTQALVRSADAELVAYGALEDVLADDEVDFAIIATPPNVRAALITPLAKAGKHILLEKPIGRDLAESEAIVALCAEHGVQLGVVFQHRARAASRKAAELVQSGALGALGLVEMAVPWWREQSYYDEPGRGTYARDGGGVLISQAIHTIDLCLSLTGPVEAVAAMAKTTRFHNMESEDYVVAGLEFSGGAVGSLVASTASFPGSAESITLHFEKGSLHLESGELRVQMRDGATEVFGAAGGTGGGADPMAFTHEWHQAVIENFAQVLRGEAEPLASGQDALMAHALIDAIVASAKNAGSRSLLT